VLHTALEQRISGYNVNGQNVVPEIYDVKEKVKTFFE
jgi:hypothetical protein